MIARKEPSGNIESYAVQRLRASGIGEFEIIYRDHGVAPDRDTARSATITRQEVEPGQEIQAARAGTAHPPPEIRRRGSASLQSIAAPDHRLLKTGSRPACGCWPARPWRWTSPAVSVGPRACGKIPRGYQTDSDRSAVTARQTSPAPCTSEAPGTDRFRGVLTPRTTMIKAAGNHTLREEEAVKQSVAM